MPQNDVEPSAEERVARARWRSRRGLLELELLLHGTLALAEQREVEASDLGDIKNSTRLAPLKAWAISARQEVPPGMPSSYQRFSPLAFRAAMSLYTLLLSRCA